MKITEQEKRACKAEMDRKRKKALAKKQAEETKKQIEKIDVRDILSVFCEPVVFPHPDYAEITELKERGIIE